MFTALANEIRTLRAEADCRPAPTKPRPRRWTLSQRLTRRDFESLDAVNKYYRGLFEGVPDAIFELINVFVGEEGVVEESIFRGTHTGRLFGLEPTGKVFALPITIVFPIMNEQILGERLYFDVATLAHQLGITLNQLPDSSA